MGAAELTRDSGSDRKVGCGTAAAPAPVKPGGAGVAMAVVMGVLGPN